MMDCYGYCLWTVELRRPGLSQQRQVKTAVRYRLAGLIITRLKCAVRLCLWPQKPARPKPLLTQLLSPSASQRPPLSLPTHNNLSEAAYKALASPGWCVESVWGPIDKNTMARPPLNYLEVHPFEEHCLAPCLPAPGFCLPQSRFAMHYLCTQCYSIITAST